MSAVLAEILIPNLWNKALRGTTRLGNHCFTIYSEVIQTWIWNPFTSSVALGDFLSLSVIFLIYNIFEKLQYLYPKGLWY